MGCSTKNSGKYMLQGISIISKDKNIDGICSVPVKPGKENRFIKLLVALSENFGIENLGTKFKCIKFYPDQKILTAKEREKNLKDVFQFTGNLYGKTVILIDDIVTTGATLRECTIVLKNAGAEEIIIVALAINQFGSSYWNTDLPKVKCPSCGSGMKLFVAGQGPKKGQFFYTCKECFINNNSSSSLDFFTGWKNFLMEENRKFKEANHVEIQDKWLEDEWDDSYFD